MTQVPAGWVSSEVSLLGLRIAAFSLCLHLAVPLIVLS